MADRCPHDHRIAPSWYARTPVQTGDETVRRPALGCVALGASATLALSACGADDGGPGEFDQGVTEVVNPSDEEGGTLRYAIASNIESTDPGNTYYGYIWN